MESMLPNRWIVVPILSIEENQNPDLKSTVI